MDEWMNEWVMKLGLTFSVQSNSHIQELQIQTNYFSILKEIISTRGWSHHLSSMYLHSWNRPKPKKANRDNLGLGKWSSFNSKVLVLKNMNIKVFLHISLLRQGSYNLIALLKLDFVNGLTFQQPKILITIDIKQ